MILASSKKWIWFTWLLALLINPFCSLRADWDLDCFEEEKSILEEEEFKKLKASVFQELADSWCSQEKANLLMELVAITRPEVCVEIGAWVGSSVLPVAATLQFLGYGKITAIDAWSNAHAIKYLDVDDPHRTWWAQVDMKEVQRQYQQMIAKWRLNSYCSTIKEPSVKAWHQVEHIDFLHIDGDLSEIGSLLDAILYLHKVKPGGYILLSNALFSLKGKQTKIKAFSALFEACDMVCSIDKNNTVLFRKR